MTRDRNSDMQGHVRLWGPCAAGLALASLLGCAAARVPWQRYYEPRYPEHRRAHEICRSVAESPAAFDRCMVDSVVPLPDRADRLPNPQPSREN